MRTSPAGPASRPNFPGERRRACEPRGTRRRADATRPRRGRRLPHRCRVRAGADVIFTPPCVFRVGVANEIHRYEPEPIGVSMFLVHSAPTARTAPGGIWVANTGQGDTASPGARFLRQGRAAGGASDPRAAGGAARGSGEGSPQLMGLTSLGPEVVISTS